MAQRTTSPPGSLADPRIEPVGRAAREPRPRGRSGQGFWGITAGDPRHLRVLVAGRHDPAEVLSWAVEELGHTMIAWDADAETAGALARRAEPDVALVGGGPDRMQALGLIEEIAHTATCPVIAITAVPDRTFARAAGRCGAFACSHGGDADELQSVIDISMERFADYQSLQGAFQRRALIEQAKGILMARHGLDAAGAFAQLRDHSRTSGRKLADIAGLIVDSHLLLPPSMTQPRTRARPAEAGARLPPAGYAGARA
jgi:response regulator NasT